MLKHHSRQTPISDGLRKELASDISSALGARQTAVDWGVAEAAADTNLFEHTAYKSASRLLRLIESHARKLTRRSTNEGDALRKWSGAMQARSISMNWKTRNGQKTTLAGVEL